MSHVTSVILIVDESDVGNVEKLNYLTENLIPDGFPPEYYQLDKILNVDAGGSKVPDGFLFWGGFNHLSVSQYRNFIKKVEWNRPDALILLVQEENEERYWPHHLDLKGEMYSFIRRGCL